MSDSNRVQRWRQQLREQGKKAATIWLSEAEEMRLKDLALQAHCSPSAIVQQALAQFAPRPPQDISNSPDTLLIQRLIREELAKIQGALVPVTDTVMDTVTVTIPETPAEDASTAPMPTMAHGTDTGNGNVTDTEALEEVLTDMAALVVLTEDEEDGTDTPSAAARPRRGIPKLTPRQVKALRAKRAKGAKIEMLMAHYGISKATVFRYLA